MFTQNFHLSLLQYAINKVDDYRKNVDNDSVTHTFPFCTLELFWISLDLNIFSSVKGWVQYGVLTRCMQLHQRSWKRSM